MKTVTVWVDATYKIAIKNPTKRCVIGYFTSEMVSYAEFISASDINEAEIRAVELAIKDLYIQGSKLIVKTDSMSAVRHFKAVELSMIEVIHISRHDNIADTVCNILHQKHHKPKVKR